MKVFITGGHITPALAYIEYALEQKPQVQCIVLGREYSQLKNTQQSIERETVEALGATFLPLQVPKLDSVTPWHTVTYIFQIIQSFYKSLRHCYTEKPSVLLSFGGYQAIPAVLAAWLMRIPIVTHEQTATAGRANRFISFFAHTIAVSFEQSISSFPQKKTVLTGNPIRATLLKKRPKQPIWIDQDITKPIIYITGGNQGSYIINTVTKQLLRSLTRDFTVVHACGKPTKNAHYFSDLTQAAKKLPRTTRDHYYLQEWISTQDLSWILSKATLAVSRAGANTVQEFMQTRVPALLIPLPFSYHNEQALNAKIMTEYGGAITVSQKDFTPETALERIKQLAKKSKSYKAALATVDLPQNAAQKLYEITVQFTQT